jgi:tetratricopeptide (TPR) repeat protein
MRRADAFAVVRRQGGTPREGVRKNTDILIVGELGWPLLADGRLSNSLMQAKTYAIPVVPERRFLEWIGQVVPDEQVKTYTAEQIASLSKLPADTVEQIVLLGLIAASEGKFGFADLAAARQVADLLGKGVALTVITKSMHDIRRWFPEVSLARVRLQADADRLLVAQPEGRTDRTGQFEMPVESADNDPDAVFAAARAAEDAGDRRAAEGLYRRVMKLDRGDAAAAFNLGNLLRDEQRVVEAESAFRAAIRADPACAEAFYNLADLLDEQGRLADAIDALRKAVDADPDYADAVFNLALFLQRGENHSGAAGWWKRYLELDATSPWASRAKRALKFCEIHAASAPSSNAPDAATARRPTKEA